MCVLNSEGHCWACCACYVCTILPDTYLKYWIPATASLSLLPYMCAHTTICVSSCYYICVLMLLCVLILLHVCPHTTLCVSSYYYVCPHTTVCFLILLYVTSKIRCHGQAPQLVLWWSVVGRSCCGTHYLGITSWFLEYETTESNCSSTPLKEFQAETLRRMRKAAYTSSLRPDTLVA